MRIQLLLSVLSLSILPAVAQDLEPRAYIASPVGVNAVTLSYIRLRGGIVFDPNLEITDVNTSINGLAVSYFRSIDFFGRSGNVGVTAPYVWGAMNGKVSGETNQISRSGLTDGRIRFAVNLKGAPTMDLEEFAGYRQKTNIGASLTVQTPTGQYDPVRLISIGANRWSFKPEIGLSRALGRRWIFDLYGGVWFFTKDSEYLGLGRSQKPVGAMQAHISHNVKPFLWAAFDATFYAGGRTTVGGDKSRRLQRNTRYGGTLSVRLTGRQGIRFAVSTGLFTHIGGDFDSFGVSYQYIWGGGL